MPDERSVPIEVQPRQPKTEKIIRPAVDGAGNLQGLLPLADALVAASVPVHAGTAARWITAGCRGVRLDAQRIGARWFTTPAAVERFVTACGA
jgi:hypothetical protein